MTEQNKKKVITKSLIKTILKIYSITLNVDFLKESVYHINRVISIALSHHSNITTNRLSESLKSTIFRYFSF